jgi:predicted nuclease of predicted toxin-antitoxin system
VKVRFLADANFNQKIVAGLLLREPSLDFALPQVMIPERMRDPDVLDLAHSSGRILVSHDNNASVVRSVR